MTFVLVRKLLRDVRLGLFVVALLLFAFQLLWSRIAFRISGQILGAFQDQGVTLDFLRETLFQGPGKIIQALLGGETIKLDRAIDMMSISYVHPLTQAILCIWAVGRGAGAIAGELDRGTMELLLAQPIRRSQVVLAHFLVDWITMPILCLCVWVGTYYGTWLVGFQDATAPAQFVDPWRFVPALGNMLLLMFALLGITLAISAHGRFRGRTLGLAIVAVLVQFLLNVVGQLWEPAEWTRHFTVFYYYQPQPIILNPTWWKESASWLRLGVLGAVGLLGYGLALWTFCRRDLPAPL